MRKFRWLLSTMAIVLAIGMSSAPAASASPTIESQGPTAEMSANYWGWLHKTETTKVAWLRQCASLQCGYHVIEKGKDLYVFCATDNAGIYWNVVWTEDGYVGHMDVSAMGLATSVSCDSAGEAIRPRQELWAHSCPSMNCGYGVVPTGHDVASLNRTAGAPEGYVWEFILDHDSVNKNLVGFVHTSDI
ncbi:MAG: hypothetical protein ABWY11_22745 [Umezawaea sp.]